MKEIVSCIIPAFNLSKESISNTINRLPEEVNVVLICHNEHSPSRIDVFNIINQDRDIKNITIPFQVGKSEAVRYGINFILNEYKDCNILSQIDGDLKQYPEEIGNMIYNFRQRKYSMLIGNRYAFSDLKKQTHRIATINWVSSIIKCVTGYNIVDTLCGMRVYSRELAEQFLEIRSFGYGLELEQILIAGKLKLNIDNHPIHSNIQYNETNAGKIEDNLYALICYCHDLRYSENIRHVLNYALAMTKRRMSCKIDLSIFGSEGIVYCKYIGNFSSENAYTSGNCKDGYSFSL